MSQSPEYTHSELPAIQLFQQMGYQYFNASVQDERADFTEVLLKDRLVSAIKRINPWINDNNLNKAYTVLTAVNGASLMEINQKIWELLRGGTFSVKQIINGVEEYKSVHFIDYTKPENNDFLVVTKNDGMTYKRLENKVEEKQSFLLKPDNTSYQAYEVPVAEILELWKFTCSINTQEYEEHELKLSSIIQMFNGLGVELEALKKSLV
jgi:type I site-specific restriction-modification system R (restriction) subunit